MKYTVHVIDANGNRLTSEVRSSWEEMSHYARFAFDRLVKSQGISVYDDQGNHLETVMKYG